VTFERDLYDEEYWTGLHPHHWFKNPPRKYAERDRDVLRVVAPLPSDLVLELGSARGGVGVPVDPDLGTDPFAVGVAMGANPLEPLAPVGGLGPVKVVGDLGEIAVGLGLGRAHQGVGQVLVPELAHVPGVEVGAVLLEQHQPQHRVPDVVVRNHELQVFASGGQSVVFDRESVFTFGP